MNKRITNQKLIGISVSLFLLAWISKFTIWDNENNRWLIEDAISQPDSNYKSTVASPIELVQNGAKINDASKLNIAAPSDLIQVKSKQNILDSITQAKSQHKRISLSGARHSMGGQNLGEQIHLDMNGYDKVVDFENRTNTVTIESGITWKKLQAFLITKNRAIRVMQDSNIFTIGGSIGSNVHGKDIRYGSLIESINWFKMIDSSGKEILVNRDINKELFESVVSGFGLFGIITEVNLKTEPNTNYRYTITNQPAETLVAKFDQYAAKGAEQIEGHFSIAKNDLLKDLQIYYFEPSAKQSVDDISGENSIWLRKLIYRLSRDSNLGKQLRWFMQTQASPILDPHYTTRNGSQAAPFRVLELNDPSTTDVLQEYFVPSRKIDEFLPKYRELLTKHSMNLINCGVRKVRPDREALISYATEEMYGFVCYYNVSRDKYNHQTFHNFTGEILDYLIEIDAKYYLAYNFMNYTDKIERMYPNLRELLNRKHKYDPTNIFWNKWIDKFETGTTSKHSKTGVSLAGGG